MKRKLALVAVLLLFVAGFSACKKQDEATKPLRTKILGKWNIAKIEVKTGSDPIVTTNYTADDYIDFKDNDDDAVELRLGANDTKTGSFAVIMNSTFFLDFSAKDLECEVVTISERQFQFTGKRVGSNPAVTETYYLTR
ncbi:MAG: hypothetical protein EOO47_11795 [Flavobacterium sp.]|nr:MAG: hypothetical protein EOO47_11795 [Flavobacterium sp.]